MINLTNLQQNQLIQRGWLQWQQPSHYRQNCCQAKVYDMKLMFNKWYLFYRCQCCQEIVIKLLRT